MVVLETKKPAILTFGRMQIDQLASSKGQLNIEKHGEHWQINEANGVRLISLHDVEIEFQD